MKIVSNEEGLLGGIKLWQGIEAKPAAGAGVERPRRIKRRAQAARPGANLALEGLAIARAARYSIWLPYGCGFPSAPHWR